jgi:hypothetical protein
MLHLSHREIALRILEAASDAPDLAVFAASRITPAWRPGR